MSIKYTFYDTFLKINSCGVVLCIDISIKRLDKVMAKHKNWHGANRKRMLKAKLEAHKNK